MKSRLQPLLVALLLLFFAFPSSDAAAADESNSVCTANDAGAECSAATISEEDDDDTPSSCVDEHEECQNWSEHGECDKNPGYMLFNCKRSCKVCPIIDDNDFGKPQEIPQGENFDKVREVIIKSTEYMRRIRKDEVYHEVRQMCLNQHAGCSQWAVESGCEDNPHFMKKQCAPACQSCDFILHVYNECKFDPNKADNAIESGGMDLLFETIIVRADDFGFEPTIWSRPKKMPNAHGYLKPCEKDIYNPCGVPDGPWVLTLENFVSSKEVDILKEWGAKFGYERSLAGDQVNDVRTSSQTWCTGDCYADPVVAALREKIHQLTDIPEQNSEYLQLLKYEEGQFYKQHNDFIVKHVNQLHGPRLLTFFIYFNKVEEGGGTRFPKLNNLTIEPAQGRVLIWPSISDEDVNEIDSRTDHEALAVIKGEKYAANAWLHLRDFQTSFKKGCDS